MPHLQVLERGTVTEGGVDSTVLVLQLTNPLDQGVDIALRPASPRTTAPDADSNRVASGDAVGTATTSDANTERTLVPRSTVVRAAPTLAVTGMVALPQGVLSVAEHDPAHEYTPEEATGAGAIDVIHTSLLRFLYGCVL